MCSHDNDTIAHMAFDQDNQEYIYLLTVSGVIEIWSLQHMQRVNKFQLSQQACKLFVL